MTQAELIRDLIEKIFPNYKERNDIIFISNDMEFRLLGNFYEKPIFCYRVSSLFLSIKKVDVVTDTSTANNIHKPNQSTLFNVLIW